MRSALPVIIPPHGTPIGALSAEEIRRLEEEEDIERLGLSVRCQLSDWH